MVEPAYSQAVDSDQHDGGLLPDSQRDQLALIKAIERDQQSRRASPSDLIVTVHPDGLSDRGIMVGVSGYTDDSMHVAKANLLSILMDRFESAPICGWNTSLFVGLSTSGPMTLASACPFLLATGHSHVVAFIPTCECPVACASHCSCRCSF